MQQQWFKYVSCMIVYSPAIKKFLLGKRRPDEDGGGKWAVSGGSECFPESESRADFARRELNYDFSIPVDTRKVKLLKSYISGDQEKLFLKDYFFYEYDGEYVLNKKERALVEAGWFSLKEIQAMAQRGEMAFQADLEIGRAHV